jgi:hypothetical protein
MAMKAVFGGRGRIRATCRGTSFQGELFLMFLVSPSLAGRLKLGDDQIVNLGVGLKPPPEAGLGT